MTSNIGSNNQQQTELDRRLAMLMFALTMIWLAIAGSGMHIAGAAMNLMETDPEQGERYLELAGDAGILLLVLWPFFWAETYFHWRTDGVLRKRDFLNSLFPFLRLGGRDHVNGQTVWIPFLGWQVASDDLADDLERRNSYVMIAIALLVLPMLGIEYFLESMIRENLVLGMAVQFAQAFIWFAFAAEFVLLISLVSKKLKFAKEHWLDLLIILLPMIAFMRLFRLAGATRLTRLTKSAKIFRLRGTAMRAWRAILILQIVDRILHPDDEKRMKQLRKQIAEKKEEIVALESQLATLREKVEANRDEDSSKQDSKPALPKEKELSVEQEEVEPR